MLRDAVAPPLPIRAYEDHVDPRIVIATRPGRRIRVAVTVRGIPTRTLTQRISVRATGPRGVERTTARLQRGTTTIRLAARPGTRVRITARTPRIAHTTTRTTPTTIITTTHTAAPVSRTRRLRLR